MKVFNTPQEYPQIDGPEDAMNPAQLRMFAKQCRMMVDHWKDAYFEMAKMVPKEDFDAYYNKKYEEEHGDFG